MDPLRLPPTIRTATLDEIPELIPHRDAILRRQSALIVEGYTIKHNESINLSFRFFAEINVHTDRLWNTFLSLSELLPREVRVVYMKKNEQPFHSPYLFKKELFDVLTVYRQEITLDGLLGVGLLINDENNLQECLIQFSKYIQYWGSDIDAFREVMQKLNIPPVAGLEFVDEFPTVTEPIRKLYPELTDTDDLVANWNRFWARKG